MKSAFDFLIGYPVSSYANSGWKADRANRLDGTLDPVAYSDLTSRNGNLAAFAKRRICKPIIYFFPLCVLLPDGPRFCSWRLG